jgi:exodeoxyribonuclease V alpha subunit
MSNLYALKERGLITALDLHFAQLMQQLDGRDCHELALAAALVSNVCGKGDVCLNLPTVAGEANPDYEEWLPLLESSPIVGQPGDELPLILDSDGRLYLHRYWHYETALAKQLLALANQQVEPSESHLDQLFPNTSSEIDWQREAAKTAINQRLCIISGGPGTGKTSTVVKILALLRLQPGGDALRIALAAPTGKAAARMQESIHRASESLGEALLNSLPSQASTLHRLLGVIPNSRRFRHNRENPLPLDLLIVDEASMIDLALMAKLIDALPAHARLILLGDRDQLASVEAGAVLGDICAGVGSDAPLAQSIVLLKQSYRFSGESGIGRIAAAINKGDSSQLLQLLADEKITDIKQLSDYEAALQLATSAYVDYLQQVAAAQPWPQIFEAFNQFRLLTARRTGLSGVEALNQEIERRLRRQGVIPAQGEWYPGRPVMITRNDYNLHLYNGDLGITLPVEGRLMLLIPNGSESFSQIIPARLPDHETAYAMTVHKSQGSEFDQVLLMLPSDDSPLLSRELLYTGVTRARQQVTLTASQPILQSACRRKMQRASGLKQKLWGTTD